MASPLDFASALDSLPSRKERLVKALSDFESNKSSVAKIGWKNFDGYFKEIEKNLRTIVDEYHAQEKALEARMSQARAEIDKKAVEVSAREQASLARVQEQKDAAVAAILEEKRKWAVERKRLESGSGVVSDAIGASDVKKEQPAKKAEVKVDVKKAEAAKTETEKAVGGGSGKPAAALEPSKKDKEEDSESKVKLRTQLKILCEAMDSEGLRTLIAKHRRDLTMLSSELPPALKCAKDPAQLVIKSLGVYHPLDQKSGKPSTDLHADRRACVILLEALSEVLADPILGVEHPVVPSNLKKPAKQLADLWKSKLTSEGDSGSGFVLHVQSYLQLIASFGIASEYEEDDLCNLVEIIAHRKQTPTLCRALGLSARVSDIIKGLLRDFKSIEAVRLANAFGLFETFKPVPLLRTYLRREKMSAIHACKSGGCSQNEANVRHLTALRAVLKAIVEYKLEDQYQPSFLEQRITRLERVTSERKKSAAAGVEEENEEAKSDRKRSLPVMNAPQPKRFLSDDSAGRQSGGIAGTTGQDKPVFGASNEAQYGGVKSYGTIPQIAFDRGPVVAGYSSASAYMGGNTNPGLIASPYTYPPVGLGTLAYGSFSLVNPSYSGYNYEPSLAAAPSGYRPYMR